MDAQLTSNQRLQGKVAIITGGASGIGAATVRLFARHGCKVVIADIQDDRGRVIADELGDNGRYIHCDVAKEQDVINLVDTTVERYGKLDIMYNNAGIIDGILSPILETSKFHLERLISVNLVGSFIGAKHAARVMIPRKTGCILFTTSACVNIAGLGSHAYAVTKHGVAGLAKNLSAELGAHGIRVNCISPFAVRTNIGDHLLEQGMDSNVQMFIDAVGNLKEKTLTADEIAAAALFLASDEAGYISGLNLVVDGGFSVVNPSAMTVFNKMKSSH